MQPASHRWLVVLDFEATCDDTNPPSPQEIIEFPSVLLDGQSFDVVDDFSAFVRPVHHPELRPFCTELTTIAQSDVDAAQTFPDVLDAHTAWLTSHAVSPHDALVITCGDWDLNRMLPTQLVASGLDRVPTLFRQWCNIKVPFKRLTGRKGGMVHMLDHLGLELVGTHHRGIDDSHNIARIARCLAEHGLAIAPTAALSRKAHPAIDLTVIVDGSEHKVHLKRRAVTTLLGLASGLARREVREVRDASGTPLSSDEHLFDLTGGARLFVPE